MSKMNLVELQKTISIYEENMDKIKLIELQKAIHLYGDASEYVGYIDALPENDKLKINALARQAKTFEDIMELL